MKNLSAYIRIVPNFPESGIQFRDITPLLQSAEMVQYTVRKLSSFYQEELVTAVVGIEARGFIFGSLVSQALGVSFVPLRKPGKLPCKTHSIAYDLEYGSAALEVHRDALQSSDRVLLVDDLIATGGSAAAAIELVKRCGATVVGAAFVIEIEVLQGRKKLQNCAVHSLICD